jgi:hypothetical protein
MGVHYGARTKWESIMALHWTESLEAEQLRELRNFERTTD